MSSINFIEGSEMRLIVVRGVPGAGKSTFANMLRESGMVDHVAEADQYFVQEDGTYVFDPKKLSEAHARCQSIVRNILSVGNSVAVANTTTTESEVKVYQDIADAFGAQFISIIVENRHGCENVHGVPDESIKRMKQRFSVKL